MCKTSDEIKLCSCEVANVDTLKHYWVLSRHEVEAGKIVQPFVVEHSKKIVEQ